MANPHDQARVRQTKATMAPAKLRRPPSDKSTTDAYMAALDDVLRTPLQAQKWKEDVLAFHKFKIGQSVRFIGGMKYSTNVRGIYKIVRLLPSETRDYQYHIKNVTDGQERVVYESELE